jgi:hypothetical protein
MAKQQNSEEVTTEIDVKTAVEAASAYFTELYSSPFADLALEEVERAVKSIGKVWLVTLGYFPARRVMGGNLMALPGAVRQYKLITVNAETGEVVSMKVAKV